MNRDQPSPDDDLDDVQTSEFGQALGAQLRRHVDQVGGHGVTLAAAAARSGRRRVLARRVATGGVLAVVAAGVAVTVPQLTHGAQTVQVAAPSTATSRQQPSSTPSAGKQTPASGHVSSTTPTPEAGTPSTLPHLSQHMAAAERGIVQSHLPGFTSALDAMDEGSIAGPVRDRAGKAWVTVGIYQNKPTVKWTCTPSSFCQVVQTAKGTVYVTESGKDKTGDGHWYALVRPDHTVVMLGETNTETGNGPLTRPTIPLDLKQATALLTDPGWDQLAKQAR